DNADSLICNRGSPQPVQGRLGLTALFDVQLMVPVAASELQRSASHHLSRSAPRRVSCMRLACGRRFLGIWLFARPRCTNAAMEPCIEKRRRCPLLPDDMSHE